MSITKAESLSRVTSSSKSRSYERIQTALSECGPLSRSQIAVETKLRLSSVCARVSELMKMGILEEVGTIYDSQSDRNVKQLALSDLDDFNVPSDTDQQAEEDRLYEESMGYVF